MVSAFIASVVRDIRDRDDVLQDVAISVIESFDRYDAGRPFNAWAIGIARNQVGLYLRRRKRDRLVFDEQTIASVADAFAGISSQQNRKLDYLRDCLDQLDGRPRELCELRYRQGLKPAAIAEAVGLSANTVAKALQRAREQLRDCIHRRVAVEGVTP